MKMWKLFVTIHLLLLPLSFCRDTEALDLAGISPGLRQLFQEHPDTAKLLRDTAREVLPSGTFRLQYFDHVEAGEAKAGHRSDASGVVIFLLRDQPACDEYVQVLFEIVNSREWDRFNELFEQAKTGAISRADFPVSVLELEFKAVSWMKNHLPALSMRQDEKEASHFFRAFVHAPDDFDSFLAYQKRVSPERDPVADYTSIYDKLRGVRFIVHP